MAKNDFIEFEVKGLKELGENLRRLPELVQKKVLARATLSAAAVIREEARRLAPVGKGDLKKSIVARKRKKKNGVVQYDVGIKKGGKDAVFYGHMVEFGTAPHAIRAEKGKALVFRPNKRASSGQAKRWIAVQGTVYVQHPGAAPRPFLRPAFDTKTDDAIAKFKQVLARAIERGEVVYWKNLKGW